MEHYITKIHIDKVRHLKDLGIELDKEKRQNLILTGTNGSGKTSLLNALMTHLKAIHDGMYGLDGTYKYSTGISASGINLSFSEDLALDNAFENDSFIIAFFSANRLTKIIKATDVENVVLDQAIPVADDPVRTLLKYMVHLATQQMYSQNRGDKKKELAINHWFETMQSALRELLSDESAKLEYDYDNYNFVIHQNNREAYGLTQLSDGYSAAFQIVADVMLRMDRNRLKKGEVLDLAAEGIVLIDEVEAHMHVELQRTFMRFLAKMFPNIQFIVSTHSPFVINSLDNAAIFDLDNHVFIKNGLADVSYEGII